MMCDCNGWLVDLILMHLHIACLAVISGMMSTLLTLFCGFMIAPQDIPTFWLFLYWTNPLHYALEGLFMTQFHDDDTAITLISGFKTTAEEFVNSFFSTWSYNHRYGDAVALLIFIVALRYTSKYAFKTKLCALTC